jgi:IS4 transposase
MDRRRNEIERLFRRLKGFRRIFSRFDKLDVMFTAFILLALIVDALRFNILKRFFQNPGLLGVLFLICLNGKMVGASGIQG